MREILVEIWESIRRNKLRTCLTGLAVSWGIFLLIVLLGAGNGVMNATLGNMGDIASNVMEIWPGYTSKPYGGYREGRRIKLGNKDLALTGGEAFSDVIDELAPLARAQSTMNYARFHFDVTIIGTTGLYKSIRKIDIKSGRFLDEKDEKDHRKCIVITHLQARTILGGKENYDVLIGKYVKINNIQYKIVGIRKAFENENDNEVYIPNSTFTKVFSRRYGEIDEIMFTFHGLETEEQNEAFEKYYESVIGRTHGAAPDDESVLWIWNKFTQNMQMNKGRNILETALWILGILTLLGGIVGVSNIMLITVKERTHEFGIRKALGATPASIIKLIIAESVAITAVFGYVGMVLGLIACNIMDATVGASSIDLFGTKIQIMENPTVGIGTAVGVTVVLIVAGTIAGLFPARKAAKVKPIEALMSVK